MDKLLTPLSLKNCVVFKLLSIVGLISSVAVLLFGLVKKTPKMSIFKKVLLAIGGASTPLLLYYIYRLFYSMCVGSLK